MRARTIPHRSFHRLTGLLIGGALVGKVLGFAREILMARLLGATFVADSFRGAMTAVLLPLAPLQGDIVPAILIPLHHAWCAEGRAPRMFASLSAMFVLAAGAITALVVLLADRWIDLVVGGFTPEAHATTRQFVLVMALAMPASALFSCLSSVELALGRSRLTSVRASVQNVGVIVGIAVTALTGHAIAIAWCFMIAFNVTAVWGAVMLWREGELDISGIRVRSAIRSSAEFLRRLRPLIVQPMADQGNIWLERLLASAAAVGTVASLDYARTLTESALFLVSQPVGFAVLSAATAATAADTRRRMMAISRPILALAMPMSVFLMVMSPDIVRLVFARGAFREDAVVLTSQALSGISVGLWAATLGWILVRLLNAAGRNARAAWILVSAYGANAAFNLAVVPHLGSLGLGLGEALRGVVLLGGTAAALGCLKPLLRLVLQVAPACALLWLAEEFLRGALDATPMRIAAGALVCAVIASANCLALMPDELQAGWMRMRDKVAAARST